MQVTQCVNCVNFICVTFVCLFSVPSSFILCLKTGSQLADYCCAESAAVKTSKETVPHYVVFVEYQNGQVMSQDKTLEVSTPLFSFQNMNMKIILH